MAMCFVVAQASAPVHGTREKLPWRIRITTSALAVSFRSDHSKRSPQRMLGTSRIDQRRRVNYVANAEETKRLNFRKLDSSSRCLPEGNAALTPSTSPRFVLVALELVPEFVEHWCDRERAASGRSCRRGTSTAAPSTSLRHPDDRRVESTCFSERKHPAKQWLGVPPGSDVLHVSLGGQRLRWPGINAAL
jgi:hypothetical protein